MGARRAATLRALDEARADAIVLGAEANVAYLSGYLTPSWANRSRPMALILDRRGRCAIAVSSAEAERVAEDAVHAEPLPYLHPSVVRDEGPVATDFGPAVVENICAWLGPVRRVATELRSPGGPGLAPGLLDDLTRGLGAELIDAGPVLWPLRLLKSRAEIDCLTRAANALEHVFAMLSSRVEVGMTEREIYAALLTAAADAGADRVGYAVVVAGVREAVLGGPRDRRWEEGELLLVDVGLVVAGYWADFCRHISAGRATVAQHDAYRGITRALEAGRLSARPGATAGEVAAAVAGALPISRGAFGRLGHGIGLEIAEPPSVHLADETELQAGMVLCIEPSCAIPGVGTLVGEEIVAITNGDARLVSPAFPEQLQEVGA